MRSFSPMVKKLIFASEEWESARRLMPLPAHSTSADHPVVPCNAQFRSPRSPLDSARGTGAGSACPGDCALLVVMGHVLLQGSAQRSLPEQDELRQAFLFHRSHPAFRIGVQIRTPGW